jgi:hypothetical protein
MRHSSEVEIDRCCPVPTPWHAPNKTHKNLPSGEEINDRTEATLAEQSGLVGVSKC